MSHPVDNDIDPGSINNYPQHAYPYLHPQHQPQPHYQSQPPQHGGHHHQQQQQQQPQHQYFSQLPPQFDANGNKTNDNGGDHTTHHHHHHHEHQHQHHHQSPFPVILSYTRPTFNQNSLSYTALPSGVLDTSQVPQAQITGHTGAPVLSHKPTWAEGSETSSQQKGDLVGAVPQGPTAGVSPYQSDMRFIRGPLEVLNAEQYDDGRYSIRHGLSKPEAQMLATATAVVNPKKRGRKASSNEQGEHAEEPKRARGRPRIETDDNQDMKARRKDQIRRAQRAYRERKDAAITVLEEKVAGLAAGYAELDATFQTLVADYARKHAVSAQMPELGRRLQQFQTMLTQHCSTAELSLGGDEATSKTASLATGKNNDSLLLQPQTQSRPQEEEKQEVDRQMQLSTANQQQQQEQKQKQHNIDEGASAPLVPLMSSSSSSQSHSRNTQQLLGGIIVTHEPETQVAGQTLPLRLDSFDDADYTFVRMPNLENASFYIDAGFLDDGNNNNNNNNAASSMMLASTSAATGVGVGIGASIDGGGAGVGVGVGAEGVIGGVGWSPSPWESLPMPSSGAFLERTLGRRLHRRTTERAARLLAMENPPYDVMLRVFGFVLNYASLRAIRRRVGRTLRRTAGEDLDAYAQPFHRVGGAGTHFAGDARTVAFPGGPSFPNAGFGMGPFDRRTTAVRDDLLDVLQRSKLPGWRGEWFDSYDVEQFLAQKAITLPQGGGEGYVEIPPGEFYEKPSDDDDEEGEDDNDAASSSLSSLSPSPPLPSPSSAVRTSAAATGGMMRTAATPSFPSPTWSSLGPVSPGILAMSHPHPHHHHHHHQPLLSGNMSPLLTYHNNNNNNNNNATLASSSSLGFPNNSHQPGYPSPGAVANKRVWFSVEKFIESLGSRGTCVGRGPAFRKKDVVKAFWEAVKSGPE